MKNTLFFLVLLSLSFNFACKNGKDSPLSSSEDNFNASIATLAGNWVNMSFVSKANTEASIIKAQNKRSAPFAYAFTFLSQYPDSIVLFRGDSALVRPVKYNVDTVEILNVNQGRSLFFVYNSNGEKDITFFDNSSGRTVMDKFIKTNNREDLPSGAFARAINYNLFPTDYIYRKGKNTQQVIFRPEGLLGGLEEYVRYAICLRGDCFKSGPDIDVMMLFDKNSKLDYYGFRLSPDKSKLELIELKPTDESGNSVFEQGEVKYTLIRREGLDQQKNK